MAINPKSQVVRRGPKRLKQVVHTAKMLPYEVEKRWPGETTGGRRTGPAVSDRHPVLMRNMRCGSQYRATTGKMSVAEWRRYAQFFGVENEEIAASVSESQKREGLARLLAAPEKEEVAKSPLTQNENTLWSVVSASANEKFCSIYHGRCPCRKIPKNTEK